MGRDKKDILAMSPETNSTADAMSDERRDKEQALLWRGRVDDVRARNSIRTRGAEGNEGKGRAMQNAETEQSTVIDRKKESHEAEGRG